MSYGCYLTERFSSESLPKFSFSRELHGFSLTAFRSLLKSFHHMSKSFPITLYKAPPTTDGVVKILRSKTQKLEGLQYL